MGKHVEGQARRTFQHMWDPFSKEQLLKLGSGANLTQEKPDGSPRLGSTTGTSVLPAWEGPGPNRRPGPELEPHPPQALSRLSSAIPAAGAALLVWPLCWAPGLGRGPSACAPSKLLFGNISGHTKTLCSALKRGPGDRDHHPRGLGRERAMGRGASMPHSEDGQTSACGGSQSWPGPHRNMGPGGMA